MREVVDQIDRKAGCEEIGGGLDGRIDLEVEVLGEPGGVGSPKLVRVAALDNPLPWRGDQQAGEKPVDRDDEVDAAWDDTGLASRVGHADDQAGPTTGRRPAPRLRHSPALTNGWCRRSSSRSSRVSIARARASRAAETS